MKILFLLSLVFIYFTIINAQTIKEECIWWVDYSANSTTPDGSFEKPYLLLNDAIEDVVLPINKCGDSKNATITRIIYIIGGSNENVYNQSSITISDIFLFSFPILIQAVDRTETYQFNNSILPFNPNNYAVFVGTRDSFIINFQSSSTPFTVRGLEFRDGGYSDDFVIQSTVIVTSQSSVSFDYCRFINNTGGNHGALFFNSQESTSITNCLFENNQASLDDSYGGALTIPLILTPVSASNVIFRNNSASNGGAVYCSHPYLYFSNITFENNNGIRGGALYTNQLPKVSTIEWNNFTFKNNNATYGGALYDFRSSNIYNSITFESNKAMDGGATYLNNSIVTIVYSNFNSNSASAGGGAIYARDVKGLVKYNQLVVEGSNFTSNSAANGGALYCVDAIARFNVDDRYDASNKAINSSTNIDYCLTSCITTAKDCGCPGGCGIEKKDNNPNTNAKIAVAIFLPITLILLGMVAFLLWKTNSKAKSFRTKVAPYDEIRLSPASQDTDDQL